VQSDAVDSVLAQVGTGTQAQRLVRLRTLQPTAGGTINAYTRQEAMRAIMGTLNVRGNRAAWVKSHPEAAIFFNSGGVLTPQQQAAIKAAVAAQK